MDTPFLDIFYVQYGQVWSCMYVLDNWTILDSRTPDTHLNAASNPRTIRLSPPSRLDNLHLARVSGRTLLPGTF